MSIMDAVRILQERADARERERRRIRRALTRWVINLRELAKMRDMNRARSWIALAAEKLDAATRAPRKKRK